MRFGEHFESLKIPEWYSMYLDYELLKSKIEDFQEHCKNGTANKLESKYGFENDGNNWDLRRKAVVSAKT